MTRENEKFLVIKAKDLGKVNPTRRPCAILSLSIEVLSIFLFPFLSCQCVLSSVDDLLSNSQKSV